MKLLIVVHHRFDLWQVPAWFAERLAQEFPQLQIAHRDSYDGIDEDLRDAEIIFTISLRPEAICRDPEPALDSRALGGGASIAVSGTGEQRRRGHELARGARSGGCRACHGVDLRAGQENSAGRGAAAEAHLGAGSDVERRRASARNCRRDAGSDWRRQHWSPGRADGVGAGDARDRGAGACGEGKSRRAWRRSSLRRRSTICCDSPITLCWPRP